MEVAPKQASGHDAAISLHNLIVCETILGSWVPLTRNQQKWKKKVQTHKVHLGPGFTVVSLSTLYLETGTNPTSKLEKRGNYSDKSGRSHLVWFTQRIPSIFLFSLVEELYIQLSSEEIHPDTKQSGLGLIALLLNRRLHHRFLYIMPSSGCCNSPLFDLTHLWNTLLRLASTLSKCNRPLKI